MRHASCVHVRSAIPGLLLLICACGAPAPRSAPPVPRTDLPPTTAARPSPATFFVGAQQGKDPIDLVAPMIDEAARNVVWIADRSVLGHYDIATGARRLIKTRYELLMTESPRAEPM
jgi:hypothetical protein